MPRVEVVFRTLGERTSELALELAIAHLHPAKVHVIEDVRPLSAAVEAMGRLAHRSDFVVYVDADCLIFEDLGPFLERNERPYVDCYVSDPFRGRIHCGVHITRIDVVREMARIAPPEDDPAFLLRPESRLRNQALGRLGEGKAFKGFDILHDGFQHYRDIFTKYALRELRSRQSPHRTESLDLAATGWIDRDGTRDLSVARLAIDHARAHVPAGAGARELSSYLDGLPAAAATILDAEGIVEKGPLRRDEVDRWRADHAQVVDLSDKHHVFGIGLSRTGTRSLTAALHAIGFDTLHYPADEQTFEALSTGRFDFPLLADYDGITDITVAHCYEQLDRRYPGSKFVLTLREKEQWLRSARGHWTGRPAFEPSATAERERYLEVRRLLRAAVYGCYAFDEERFSWVYDQHVRNVTDHFAGREEDLLVYDLCGGDGWEPLCHFLDRPVPLQPFPHKGNGLARKLGAVDGAPPQSRTAAA